MKKRLLSLLLVLAVVFSFSLSAFATDTGIDIIDDPLSYYFENQMLGVQKGTGVTLVCPKCDYKVVYTGGTLVTCPYDGEALVLADLAGVHAEKVPSGIGRKDLPGYIDNSGTAHVSKEGKLKFVAHPCWLDVGEQESNKFTLTDPYKPYRVQEEDEDYGLYVYDWLGYNNGISHFSLYTQPLSDDMYYGNFDFYWIIDSGFVPGTYYVAADQPTVKNFYSKYGAEPQILKTKAGEYNLPNDSYWGLGNLGLSDYNAVWHERRWFYAENAKSTSIDIYLYPFLVTCDPTENPVEEKKEVTIEDNKFTGNIYSAFPSAYIWGTLGRNRSQERVEIFSVQQILPRRGGDLRSGENTTRPLLLRRTSHNVHEADGRKYIEMTTEPRPKGKHFTKDERAKIETLRKAGHTHQYIADFLGCCRSAVTKEIKKGQVDHLDGATWLMTKVYDAYAAQKYADYQKTAHSKGLKLGNNHAYAAAVASCIKQKYSPYAAIQLVGDIYGLTVSKQTLYRYIAEGLIPNVSYKHLPVGHPKKRKNAVQADEQPIRARNTLHRSIEQHPKNVNLRDAFGHWEIDSIVGSSKGKKESCLVITERMTRQEIVLKVSDKTAASTTKAMQRLKQKLGRDFNKLFLTISSDNGCEFADQDGFDNLGVPVFYCHPQAPHERGSNENNNKLLRRHFPKGESMKKKTQYDATLAQHFINGYPREMFDGKSSGDLFRDELQKLNLSNPEKVYSFFNLAV